MTEKPRDQYTDHSNFERDRTRRTYSRPQLTQFGQVATLTQGGDFSPSPDGTTGMMGMSDRRLKEDVRRVGRHPYGFGLYLFNYKPKYRDAWGHGRQFGVMADEVEQVMPEAVSMYPDGYKMVDYAMLGISRNLH